MFKCFQLSPSSRIIEALDVVKYIRSCFTVRLLAVSIDSLSFQHTEEAFTGHVVGIATNTAHGARQVVALEKTLIFNDRKLTAALTVQDNGLTRCPLPKGHQHSLQYQLTTLIATHPPADN